MVALPWNNAYQGVVQVDKDGNPVGPSAGDVASVKQGALTDKSGTIASGGTAQQLAAANSNRRYLLIQNLSTGVLWVSTTATAVVGQPSIALKACTAANDGTGGVLVYEGSFIPTGAVSIIGATTSQAFAAREG